MKILAPMAASTWLSRQVASHFTLRIMSDYCAQHVC